MKKSEFEGVGFEDKWVISIGILIMGIVFPLVNGIFFNLSAFYIMLNIIFSTFSSAAMWLGCRFIIFKAWHYFPWDKKPVKHLLFEIAAISVFIFFTVKIVFVVASFFLSEEVGKAYIFADIYVSSLIISLIISFIHEAVFFYMLWMKTNKRAEQLERENLLSQYETLKNQINPHFLFNSFNTLITLIEEDKDAASDYTQKLSDFFRIILQLRDKSIIPLKEELELIDTYVYIQKKRYGNNLVVNKSIPENTLEKGVAPLSLQMLVENAVKHNVISTEKPLIIEISVTGNNYLLVRNNFQKRNDNEASSGLGLINIQNRYSFLSDKKPEIIVNSDFYAVALPLLDF